MFGSNKNLAMAPDGGPTKPRRTGRLTVGRKITRTRESKQMAKDLCVFENQKKFETKTH
jgi:hypothetical protein